MDPDTFAAEFAALKASFRKLVDAADADCEIIGSLSLEDYQLFVGMFKEYQFYQVS